MSLRDQRNAVTAAQHQLRDAQARYRKEVRRVSRSVREHRSAVILGGGLLGGIVAALLPMRDMVSTGSALTRQAAALAATPLGAMAVGALLGRKRETDPTTGPD